MDQWGRFPPGPTGTSCLTCKRRHKKCDRSKPICEACSKGGFECLGYGHNKPNEYSGHKSLPSKLATPTCSNSLPGSSALAPPTSFHVNDDPRSNGSLIFNDVEADPSAYNMDGATRYLMPSSLPQEPRQVFSITFECCEDNAATYDAFPSTGARAQIAGTELPSSLHSTNTVVQQPIFFSDPLVLAFTSEVPRGVSITPSDIRNIVKYVISHFDRVRGTMYFKPQDNPIENTRRVAVWRLSTCAFARGGMLLDASIRDSILEGAEVDHSQNFARINSFEQAICAQLDRPLDSYELRERLIDNLEMFFAKSVILNATATYRLFCCFAPRFLQIVNHTSTLCWADRDATSVSIAHLLASPFYECVNYIFMDIIGSMVYGLPQILEYNTDIALFHARLHPVEWVNCLPGDFLVLLSKINIHRDHGGGSWRDIERQLVSWVPQPKFEPKGLESWKLITWRALEEIWRHTLLIYLYLAVCGASTDDSRIQSSLRQVFQLLGVIKRQDQPAANPHLFTPIFIAGICSRTEKQRRLVRERLGFAAESRFWLFRSPEFVPILDHLWLGAGMEGQPITWNDYFYSRHVMMPLFS